MSYNSLRFSAVRFSLRRFGRRWWIGLGATIVAAVTMLGLAPAAFADIVHNDLASSAGGVVTVAPGGSATVSYWIEVTSGSGDTQGCDATGSAPAAVSIANLTGVTVAPQSFQMSGCGSTTTQAVRFTVASNAVPGDRSVTVGVTGGKSGSSYSTDGAAFTLRVTNPNTPPTVLVSGPTNGADYEKGSVPAASCNVSDKEDGSSTFAATLSAVTGTLSSYGLGSQTASCSYTDNGGLSASASVTYNIVDTTAPVLKTPSDQTVEATSSSGATASWTNPTATDAVDPSPTQNCASNSGLKSGDTFPMGTTLVQCTATDESGNTANGQFNVIVQDTTKPTLSLPADISKEATGPGGATVSYAATADDAVDGAVTPSCTPASGTTFPVGRTPVNCTATDKSNNSAGGGFNVNVVDTTAPALSIPGNQTLEATGPNDAAYNYSATATDIVDGKDKVSCDSPSGTVFGLGSTTVTCTATDAAGNLASSKFTVTVQDTTAPKLTVPADITTEASKQAGADVTYDVSASDLVDGNVAPVCTPQNGTFPVGTTTVSCTATDMSNNTAKGSFTVTVTDTTPPVFANVPGDQTVEATGPNGASATFSAPTANDLVDGATNVTCDRPATDTYPLGTTKVTCTTTDAHHNGASVNFDITVQDTTPPAVTVPDNKVLEATGPNGATASWSAVSASDIVDGTDPVSCDHNSGDTLPLGVTTVTCSATDNAGNPGSASFTVSVRDTTAPEVNPPANQTNIEATGPNGATASWEPVNGVDIVDGTVPATCAPTSGSTFRLGTTTVDCAATDNAGNTGHGAFTIQVVDTTPPTLTVPADKTLEATGPNGAPVPFSASASDIVDGSADAVTCSAKSGDTFGLGDHAVTCTATDQAGNVGTATFHITVVDTTAPALTIPGDKTLEATGPSGAKWDYSASVSATDLVDGAVTPDCSPAANTTFPLGTTTVNCTAIDAHGNQATKSFKVTVQDSTAPTMNGLTNVTVFATSASGAPVNYTATATDLVDGTVNANCSPASGSTFAPGTTTVSCTAADTHGNTSPAATFTVTVRFDFAGFLAPVDTNKVLNGMKAGSTAPMKWQVSNEKGGYLSDLSIVSKTTSGVASCTTGSVQDDLSQYATGSTTLRYDTTANQYMYNWQAPKTAGSCYQVTIGLTDGSAHSVVYQLK